MNLKESRSFSETFLNVSEFFFAEFFPPKIFVINVCFLKTITTRIDEVREKSFFKVKETKDCITLLCQIFEGGGGIHPILHGPPRVP